MDTRNHSWIRSVALGVLIALVALPMTLLAQVATSTLAVGGTASAEDIVGWAQMSARAFHSHNWMLLSGLVLMALVYIIRRFEAGKAIPDVWVPWLTMALAMGASTAIGLQTHKDAMTIVTAAVLSGVAACGGWETFGKLLHKLLMLVLEKLRGATS